MPPAAVVLLAGTALAADWPGFRGGALAGVARDAAPPADFGPAKNVRWRVEPPRGHSSPIVAGSRVVVTGADEKQLLTIAYDLSSGKELWRRALPRVRKGKLNGQNSPATPTPVSDGRSVFAVFQDAGVAAYDLEGRPLWTFDLPAVVNNHGMGASPVLAGPVLAVVLSGESESWLLGIDKASGKQVWKQPLAGVTYSTPAAIESRGVALIAAVATRELAIFRASDGRKTAWLPGIPYQPKNSPTGGDVNGRPAVFFAVPALGGEKPMEIPAWADILKLLDADHDGALSPSEAAADPRMKGAFVQLDVDGDGKLTSKDWESILALNRLPASMGAVPADASGDLSGREFWVVRRGVPVVSSLLVDDGVVYSLRDGGIFSALDAATGEAAKQGRLEGALDGYFSSPVRAGGRIVACSRKGKVAVVRPGREWEVERVVDLGDEISATPAFAAGAMLLRTHSALYCFAEPER